MNIYTISSLSAFVISIILALFVLFNGLHDKSRRAIIPIIICAGIWCAFPFMAAVGGINNSLFFTRLVYIAAVFTAPFFLNFGLTILELEKISHEKNLIRLSFAISIFFFLPFLTSSFFIKEVNLFKPYFTIRGGLIYLLFIAFFGIVCLYCFHKLFIAYKEAKGFRRNQLKYVFLGFFLAFISGLLHFSTSFNIPEFFPHDFLVVACMLVLIYSIIRYRLMDIRLAITRASIFIAVYTIVLGIPFALGIWFKPWLSAVWGVSWWMVPLGLMAIFATTGPFIYIYLNKRAEEEILKEQRRYQDTLKRASLGMTRVRDINKLLKMIVYTVARAVRLNHAAVYILNKEADGYILGSSRGSLNMDQIQTIGLDSPLIRYLLSSKSPLLLEELANNSSGRDDMPILDEALEQGRYQKNYLDNLLKAQLYTLSASVVIPSFIEDDLLGFMVLGEKRSGSIYTEDDLRVFTVLASQAGLAIENARFFESAKETHEQISQAEKMATLGTMADGLSHQMNNRFHAMSLIASDALDCIKSSDSKNSSSEIKELLSYLEHSAQRIKSNSLQGGDIVRGMLKYTRKGETGFAGVNLDELLNAALEMLQFKIKLNEIDIERNYPKEETNLKANFTQLQEVFFNLIDNAYDAMNERKAELKEPGYRGKVKIVAIPDPANRVTKIIVHDNGLGIKEEDQKKVFTPFFTTKISNRKGTGLGLYVIKKIITENHKGRIQVSSIYKQGTTFSLELATADTAEHANNAHSKGNIEIWGE